MGLFTPTWQHNFAHVRARVAVVAIETTARQRLVRGDKRNQVVSMERGERTFGDLVDIWYVLPNGDPLGCRGLAQIAAVND